jgi:hypothetical protein
MEGSPSSDAPLGAVAWGDSRMGRLIARHDWSKTGLGDPKSWPISLQTALRIAFGSQRPQSIWWGSELIQFCNDRFWDQFGALRDIELQAPAAVNWADVWEAAADRISAALAGDEGWTAPIAIAGVVGKDGPGALTLLALGGDDGEPAGFLCEWTASQKNKKPVPGETELEERDRSGVAQRGR